MHITLEGPGVKPKRLQMQMDHKALRYERWRWWVLMELLTETFKLVMLIKDLYFVREIEDPPHVSCREDP
jgi:hypothetical protein